MSTQSIFQNDLEDVKSRLDEHFACLSNKMLLESKFGFKFSMTSTDTFLFNYLYELINKDTNCYLILNDECTLEKVNKLLLKYK
jgi:hypothetical protein